VSAQIRAEEVAFGPPPGPPGTWRRARGVSLLDLLMALALMLMAAAGLMEATRQLRAERAGREAARLLLHDLQRIARHARLREQTLAVELRQPLDAPAMMTVYADGNGNGVRGTEIAAGIDAPLGAPRLAFRDGTATLAIVASVPSADGTGVVAAGSSPVRFGIAPYISFSPRGTGPSGSVYVAGPTGAQYAIRVLGTTGRLRLSCFQTHRHLWSAC
jgi:hypothetical protein